MNATPLIVAAVTCVLSIHGATAGESPESPRAAAAQTTKRGNHPAEIVARLHASAGYDYASKFYLHPARLELLAEAPRERGQHPAVLVAAQWGKRGYDYVSKFYLHPARLELLAEAPRTMVDHPAVIVARSAERPQADGSQGTREVLIAQGVAVVPQAK